MEGKIAFRSKKDINPILLLLVQGGLKSFRDELKAAESGTSGEEENIAKVGKNDVSVQSLR